MNDSALITQTKEAFDTVKTLLEKGTGADPATQATMIMLAHGLTVDILDKLRARTAEIDPEMKLPSYVESRRGPVTEEQMIEFVRENLL